MSDFAWWSLSMAFVGVAWTFSWALVRIVEAVVEIAKGDEE